MDDLARDFGFRPQGKSAPMRSDGSGRGSASVQSSPFNDDHDGFLFNDAYGGTSKYTSTASTGNKSSSVNDYDYDSIFKTSSGSNNVTSDSNNSKTSSFPVYDKPVYDDVYEDDIFQGLPGLKSKSVSSSTSNNRVEENIFASMVSPPKNNRSDKNDHFDDLLGNFGGSEKVKPEPKSSVRSSTSQGGGEFDDLLGGFGSGSSTSGNRSNPGPVKSNPGPGKSKQTSSSVMNDPFAGLETTSTPGSSYGGVFTDPLEEISKLGKFETKKADPSPVSGGVFDDLDPLNGFGKSIPPFSPEKDQSPSRSGTRDHSENLSFNHSQKKTLSDNFHEAPLFDMPSVSTHSNTTFAPQNVTSPPPYENVMSPKSEDQGKFTDEIWLTVSEIPLFTQPTKAPPPSRPPPPIPRQNLKADTSFFSSDTPRYTSSYSETPKTARSDIKTPSASQIDGLEDFAMGRTQNEHASEDMDAASAAMKDAMDRAEAKFKHAKEVKEREHAKARNKETVQTEDNEREQVQREKEEEEREKEQRRIERARQAEVERVRARQAVERATREARERAAQGAREKQAAEAKQRAEKIAVEKAQAEARERAGRVAVQRAQAEARERAANEAKERAEKAAAENREKDAKEKAEARRRAERASVDRATAEARDRAAAEARDRAAARTNQQRNDNDLDSFFSSRPNSVPKPRPTSYDPFFDAQTQGKGRAESASNKPTFTSVPTPNIRKVSSTTNIVDDLSSIFGASPQSGDFQDVEGETEERRRARLERHQRTQERAAKALAEKNQRDLQAQKDQEERHRHSEVLDSEIKRWAAGKEGNLRALLSTLQYVLWPECGWKPVSLTDLITGADVKKVYRRATLCIHPDKVQQKGATLQQKYIAEKVFDLLKEAWNKLNSEELF